MQNIQQSILNLLLRQCYEYNPGNYEEEKIRCKFWCLKLRDSETGSLQIDAALAHLLDNYKLITNS